MKLKPRSLFWIFFILFLVAELIFGKQGLYNLWNLKKKERIYKERVKRLNEENRRLMLEIERLKHDPEYIEGMIRRELKMVRKNEFIIYFK